MKTFICIALCTLFLSENPSFVDRFATMNTAAAKFMPTLNGESCKLESGNAVITQLKHLALFWADVVVWIRI